MTELLYVCVGGFFGAIARFLLFQRFTKKEQATLFVNVTGSFLLVVCMPLLTKTWLHMVVAIGFFGAYTTFSTFTLDVVQLAKKSKAEAAVYVARMIGYSVAAMIVGYIIVTCYRELSL